jgi:hypothetical protein
MLKTIFGLPTGRPTLKKAELLKLQMEICDLKDGTNCWDGTFYSSDGN